MYSLVCLGLCRASSLVLSGEGYHDEDGRAVQAAFRWRAVGTMAHLIIPARNATAIRCARLSAPSFWRSVNVVLDYLRRCAAACCDLRGSKSISEMLQYLNFCGVQWRSLHLIREVAGLLRQSFSERRSGPTVLQHR
jgi:hypothetical protein